MRNAVRYPVPMFSVPAEADPALYITCLCVAMLIVGLGKVGFGAGIGIVVMPILMLAVGGQTALGVLLPALIVGDLIGISIHRKHFDWSLLRWFIPGAIAGIVAGYLTLGMLQHQGEEVFTNVLSITVGSICLILIAFQCYRLTGRSLPDIPKHAITSFVIGAIECFVSSLTNSAGALIMVYMLQQKLAKQKFVATMLLFFMVVNVLKLPAFIGNEVVTSETLQHVGPFILLVPIGAIAGAWLNKRVAEKPFTLVLYAIAAVSAVRMIVKVLSEV